MNKFPTLGMILSHSYLVSGFLPTCSYCISNYCFQLTFGPQVNIPDDIILESFVDHLVQYEVKIFKRAFQAIRSNQFSQQLSNDLISLMSQHGCIEVPKPGNLKGLVTVMNLQTIAKC